MKNVVWVILGILVVVAIVFLTKKDGGMMSNNGESETLPAPQKVFVDSNGQELKATVTPESAEVSFPGVGTVKLKGTPTASVVTYKNADESIVFADSGQTAVLSKDGTVIFTGVLQSSITN